MSEQVTIGQRRRDSGVLRTLNEHVGPTLRFYILLFVSLLSIAGIAVAVWLFEGLTLVAVSALVAVVAVLSLLGAYRFRLTPQQHQYLDRIRHERKEWEGFERISSELSEEGEREIETRAARVDSSLDDARYAVYRNDDYLFFENYYKANRQKVSIYGLLDAGNVGGTSDRLEKLAKSAYNTSEQLLSDEIISEKRHDGVVQYVKEDDGKRFKQNPTSQDVFRAFDVLQDSDLERLERFQGVKQYVRRVVTAVSVALVLLFFTLVSAAYLADEMLLGVTEVLAAIPIFLVGVVGAGLFMLFLSGATIEKSKIVDATSLPDPEIRDEAILARLLTGGVSALVVIVIFAGMSNISLTDELFLIGILSFAAGYSEEFTKGTIEDAVKSSLETQSDTNPEESATTSEEAATAPEKSAVVHDAQSTARIGQGSATGLSLPEGTGEFRLPSETLLSRTGRRSAHVIAARPGVFEEFHRDVTGLSLPDTSETDTTDDDSRDSEDGDTDA